MCRIVTSRAQIANLHFFSYFRCPGIQPTLWSKRHDFTDATIACDNNNSTFDVHKIILASSSNYFCEKFLASDVLELTNIGHKDMENLIAFIYKGEITLNQDDKRNFLELLELLGIGKDAGIDETVNYSIYEQSDNHLLK